MPNEAINPTDLIPGSTHILSFPDLPEIMHAKCERKPFTAKLSLRLPDNYSPNKTFSLVVFLRGNTGGDGSDIDLVIPKTGNDNFVVATMPLFKKQIDTDEIHMGRLISFEDFPLISSSYKIMIDQLFETIPNLHPTNNCFGGFSNGAHSTSVLLSGGDETILNRFSNYFFHDGGLNISGIYKRVFQTKKLFFTIGDTGDDFYRGLYLQAAKMLEATGKELNLDLKVTVMKGVGHSLPPQYAEQFQQWLQTVITNPES